MSRFFSLLRKDLSASRMSLSIMTGIILALMAVFWLKIITNAWPWESSLIPIGLAILFLYIWSVWQASQKLNTEWKADTVYTLQVLPVPGWQVLLSKIISLWLESTVLFGVIILGINIFAHPLVQEIMAEGPGLVWIARNIILLHSLGLIIFTSIIVFFQLSFVVSRMIGRFKGLVELWVWVLAFVVINKVSQWLAPLFSWVPAIPMHKVLRLEEFSAGATLRWFLTPNLAVVACIVGLFFLASYLFDNYLEIN